MLIISRKLGESFFIGENIEITILDAQNDRIKIGIDAPQDIKIARKELREIEKVNQEAAKSTSLAAYDAIKSKFMDNITKISRNN